MIGLARRPRGRPVPRRDRRDRARRRYQFSGDAEDSSRNRLHATLRGSGAAFVEDRAFGRVLELTGSGGYVQLPGHAVAGEDAISVALWLYLPTGASGPVFDFGRNASSRLSAGVSASSGFSAGVAAGGMRGGTEPAPVPVNQWMHVTVVFDPPNGRLATYLDGARAGQAAAAGITVAQVVGQAIADASRLFLGRSQDDGAPTLQGRLRDVRVYRVALTDAQVAAIGRRRVGPTGRARPGRGSGPGNLDRCHSQGIPTGGAARTGPRHPGRDDRWPASAAAARDPGGVPRSRVGPDGPRHLAVTQGQQPGGHAGHLRRRRQGPRHLVRAESHNHRQAEPARPRRRRREPSSRSRLDESS